MPMSGSSRFTCRNSIAYPKTTAGGARDSPSGPMSSERGRYSLADGKCHWTKSYLGKHDVFYQGYNEGKGIWGTWEIPAGPTQPLGWRGGFHIWPEGMADPTQPTLSEEADLPVAMEKSEEVPEPVEIV